MIISLENFIPLPLTGISREKSGFWESGGVVLESPGSYLLTAPSGKGKTSLLSMICGVRNDYRGSILIDGSDIRLLNPLEWSEIRKRRISCIYQGLELFDELTALENIQLKNRILDFKTEHEILEMAQSLEMENFLERQTGKLSFGQRQRIAIIRSLCQPFEFLLADEIFSHLDKKLEGLTFSLISRECIKNRAGLLLTSLHPLGEFHFENHFIL